MGCLLSEISSLVNYYNLGEVFMVCAHQKGNLHFPWETKLLRLLLGFWRCTGDVEAVGWSCFLQDICLVICHLGSSQLYSTCLFAPKKTLKFIKGGSIWAVLVDEQKDSHFPYATGWGFLTRR